MVYIIKSMESRVKKQLKRILLEEDLNIKQLVPLLAKKTGREYTYSSFINRLARAAISYEEMLDIAEILGYKVKIEKG